MLFNFPGKLTAAIPLICLSIPLGSAANPIIDELEHLLVDTAGLNNAGVKDAITPCTNYVSGSQLLGRQTSGQWIRVAFHDFATANVELGIGGIDASIGFDTLLPENSGSAMNDTLGFFAPFVNEYVSMSDLIALSVVMSVGSCSGPNIPYRGGRRDATAGGQFGVPEPETSVEETLEGLARAGFNHSDAIALTVCGHTLGRVHHGGFPQVVPEKFVTSNNTGGGVPFDFSVAAFDINVVQEYLSGTGQKGGPLVTTENVTVQSDLRLYTSDNNATIQSLSKSSAHFRNTCTSMFERMINTVPREVQLTEVIVPQIVKPVNITLDVDSNGNVFLSGSVRLLGQRFNEETAVSVSISSSQNTTLAHFSGTGTSNFGPTYYYKFNTTINSTVGITSFTIDVPSLTPSIYSYPLTDKVFWVPSLSSAKEEEFIFAAAVRSDLMLDVDEEDIKILLAVPTPQIGTLSPRIQTTKLQMQKLSPLGRHYTIYTASMAPSLPPQTTFHIFAAGVEGSYYGKVAWLTKA